MREYRNLLITSIILVALIAGTLWRAGDWGGLIYYGTVHVILIAMVYLGYLLVQAVFALIRDILYQIFPGQTTFHDVSGNDIPLPESCHDFDRQLNRYGFKRLGELVAHSPPYPPVLMFYYVSDKVPVVAILTDQSGIGLVQLVTTFRNKARLFTFHPQGMNLATPTLEARIVRRSLSLAMAFHQQQLERFRHSHGVPVFHREINSIVRAMAQMDYADITATWDYRIQRNVRSVIFLLLPLILVTPVWWEVNFAPDVDFSLLAQLGVAVFTAVLMILFWQNLVRKEYVDPYISPLS